MANASWFVIYRDKPQVMEGFPMREWSVEIWLVNENGEEVPANCFEKVVYRLHQSFEKRATQGTFTRRMRVHIRG